MGSNQLNISPLGVLRALCIGIACLLLASLSGQLAVYLGGMSADSRLVRLFDVDLENNLPAYFSALLLLSSSILLSTISILERQRTSSFPRAFDPNWLVLAAGFLFLTFDELFSFHERLGKPVGALLGDGDLGLLRFSWVVPGFLVILLLAVCVQEFRFGADAAGAPAHDRFGGDLRQRRYWRGSGERLAL